jgi:hypothetical protein
LATVEHDYDSCGGEARVLKLILDKQEYIAARLKGLCLDSDSLQVFCREMDELELQECKDLIDALAALYPPFIIFLLDLFGF